LRALQVLLVTDPALCSRCNGVKVIIDAVLDPALGTDLCDTLLITVVSALTDTKSRSYFRADDEIQRILAPFTDLDATSQDNPIYLRQETKITKEDKFRSAKRAVLLLCQSSAGIGLLSSAKFGLRDVFNLLGDASTGNACVESILELTAEILDPIFLELRHESSSTSMGLTFSQQQQQRKLKVSATSSLHHEVNMSSSGGGGALGEYSELEQRIRATQQALITERWQNAADITLESKGARKFGNLVLNLTKLNEDGVDGETKVPSFKKTLSQRLSANPARIGNLLANISPNNNNDTTIEEKFLDKNHDENAASARPFDLMRSLSAFTISAMIHVGLLDSLIKLAVCENVPKNRSSPNSNGRFPQLRRKGGLLAVSLRDACLELLPRELCLSLTSLQSTFDIVSGSYFNDNKNGGNSSSKDESEENLKSQSKAMHASKLIHILASRQSICGGSGGGRSVDAHNNCRFISVSGGELTICVPGTSNVMDGINFTTYQCGFGIGTGWNLCHAISLYRRSGIHRLPLHASDFRWGEDGGYYDDSEMIDDGGGNFTSSGRGLSTPQRNQSMNPLTSPSPSGSVSAGGVSSFFRLTQSSTNSNLGGGSGGSNPIGSGVNGTASVADGVSPLLSANSVGSEVGDEGVASGGSLIIDLHALAVESKVNETKEWVRWDWRAIWTILDHCLSKRIAVCELLGLRSSSSRRLAKWAQRIGGFYRCDLSEGKAYFASLPWGADNMRFLHCASRFYCALLHCPEGRHFMCTDRRGAVYKDILLELDRVVRKADAEHFKSSVATKSTSGGLGAKMTSYLRESIGDARGSTHAYERASEDEYSLFGRAAVQETMAREYFTLLLHATETAQGSQFLVDILATSSPHSSAATPPPAPATLPTSPGSAPLPKSPHESFLTGENDDLPGPWTIFQGIAACARFSELDYLTRLLASNLNYDISLGWTRRMMECWIQGCGSEDLAIHLCGVLSSNLGNSNEASQFCFLGTTAKAGEVNKRTWVIDQLVKLLVRPTPNLDVSPFDTSASTSTSSTSSVSSAFHLAPLRLRTAVLTSLHAAAISDVSCAVLMAPQVAPVCVWLLRGDGASKDGHLAGRANHPFAHRLLTCLLGVLPPSPPISLEAALFGAPPPPSTIKEEVDNKASSSDMSSPKSFAEECLDDWLLHGVANAYPIAVQRSVADAITEGNRRAAAATYAQSLCSTNATKLADGGSRKASSSSGSRGGGGGGSDPSKIFSWAYHYFDHNSVSDGSYRNGVRVKPNMDPISAEFAPDHNYGVAIPLGMLVQPVSTDHKSNSKEFASFVSQPIFGVPIGVTFTSSDIEAITRLPWSISVTLTDMQDEAHDLRVSTSVDATSITPLLSSHVWAANYDANDISSSPDWNTQTGKPVNPNDDRLFVIRATLVDDCTGRPRPYPVSTADDLASNLMLGIDDVLSTGRLRAPVAVEEAEGQLNEDDVGDDMAYPSSFYNDDDDDIKTLSSSMLSGECKSMDRDNYKVTKGVKSVVIVPNQPCRWNFIKSSSGELMITSVEWLVSIRDVVPYTRPSPPHLIALLSRSEPGQALLNSRNVIPDILETAFPTTSGLAASLKESACSKLTREAAIWAIGSVAASEAGLALLTAHRPEILRDLLRGATSDDSNLLIRHTFFLAANLSSTTPTATRLLQSYGWDSGANSRGAVALPQDPRMLFRQRQIAFEGSPALHRFSDASALAISASSDNEDHENKKKKDELSKLFLSQENTNSSSSEQEMANNEAKNQVKDSIANLACGLTASEGKDKLLAMQRDFALATQGGGASNSSTSTSPSASASTTENSPTAELDEKDTKEKIQVVTPENVLLDPSLYLDIFRTILSGHHFNVDQRRLVHHLFRNADFTPSSSISLSPSSSSSLNTVQER
jgi:hypothetical protein